MEYLGRNDNQIKIRGYRVELEEIECAVMKYRTVRQCCVFFENNSLVCVFVTKMDNSSDKVSAGDLKLFLERLLPKFMVPQLIQYNGHCLPVTNNGKLDMKALKDFYRRANCSFEIVYHAPRDKLESELCRIFSSVLNVPIKSIGIDHDFFSLGGDSISSLLLTGKIRNQLGIQCNVKNIFDSRTIRRLSGDLGQKFSSLENPIGTITDYRIRPSGEVEMLPIQKWFFAKNLKTLHQWNQTFTIEVPTELDVKKLTESLNVLINHHDAFRLRFDKNAHGYTQYYQDTNSVDVNFYHLDVTGLNNDEVKSQLSEWTKFNLSEGPLYAVVYLHGDASFKIWWCIHHLIVDTVSWRIIKDDLQSIYEGRSLTRKGTSYQEFSSALLHQFSSEKSYWDPIIDKVRSYNESFPKSEPTTSKFEFSLDRTKSQRLICGVQKAVSKIIRINIQDILLSAVGFSLKKLTNSSTNYVTLEGHGREQIASHFDISNTIGWFTTMYPVEIRTDSFENITSCITQLNESMNSIPNKGVGYGAIYGYNHQSMPCVSFNYLGNFGSQKSEMEWNFSDLSLSLNSGEKERNGNTVVDITGACSQGCLTFSIDISLDVNRSQEFVETFKETLNRIAENIESIVPPLPFGDFETYYEFPADRNADTLFIFPPGEGGAESYFNNLVPNLKEFNLVVFNNFYLERQPMECTFEELATMYIKYVKAIRPNGPYNFLGWSFGGVLALEICRQMINSGDMVRNLFLIDSYLDVTKAITDLNISENIDIIDRINHKYRPTATDFERMCAKSTNIVLFKATLLNEMHKSEDQRRFYEYFQNTVYNNLDRLVPANRVNVIRLEGHSHNTWAKDGDAVESITSVVADKLFR